jgi:hypothetical protein
MSKTMELLSKATHKMMRTRTLRLQVYYALCRLAACKGISVIMRMSDGCFRIDQPKFLICRACSPLCLQCTHDSAEVMRDCAPHVC